MDNPPEQVVAPITAFLLSNMLADVINSGTAWKARAAGFTLPAAGKTGTTNEYRDAWFVGFTPRVVTGVWMGFDQPKTIIGNGYAGEVAVPLWAQVMKVATNGDEPAWLERPKGIVAVPVCRVSGKLPAEGCSTVEVMRKDGGLEVRSMVYPEYFAPGTAPDSVCDLHPAPSWFQRVAEVFSVEGREPVRETELSLPPPAPAPAPQTGASVPIVEPPSYTPVAEQTQVEEKPKKRGFWGRLFGRRDKGEDQKPREKPSEQNPSR
jgi:membrane peptidoglycan carboxypeptidase